LQQVVKSARATSARFAVSRDFCKVFAEQTNELYVLALLLTGNHESAQQCFVGALEDCFKATAVFKDWAGHWARRAIVHRAMSMVKPSRRASQESASIVELPISADRPLAAILSLGDFDRFAFVLSVLEHYPDQECKTLLDCTRGDVVEARTHALKQIGQWGEAQHLPALENQRRFFAQAS